MYSFIHSLKQQTPVSANPYFRSLESQEMSKEAFVQSQLDFYSAVIYFSRPMLQVASRLPTYPQRWTLLENAVEEHGNGSFSQTHGHSFRLLLENLGVAQSTIVQHVPHSCVDIFNLCLKGVASGEDWQLAIAAFGIIEDRFAEISARIGQAIVDNGWLLKEHLRHYTTHEVLDISHANELYQLIEPYWSTQPLQPEIKRGIRLGNHLFLQLYRQLWQTHCCS